MKNKIRLLVCVFGVMVLNSYKSLLKGCLYLGGAFVACVLCFLLGIIFLQQPVSSHGFSGVPEMSLQNGDIIFVRGATVRGKLVRLLENDVPYSHVGIIVFSGPGIDVVHASPGKGENHFIQQQSLDDFLSDEKITDFAIYRVSEDARVCEIVRSYVEKCAASRVPFDDAFSIKTKDTLYCTELVWRAYLAANINLCKNGFSTIKNLFIREPIILPSTLLKGSDIQCVIKIHK